ncbi:MAG TPA: 30S ribosomal protein S1, partial [Micropruina sp.]|nr:30S ribosomal protein S1 [Micropruina sp.]
EGFDPETQEWKPGYEEQQAAWERQYAEAQARWEAHKQQVKDAEAAGVEAAVAEASTAAYSAGGAATTQAEGSLASDEALQALRDRLTGNR